MKLSIISPPAIWGQIPRFGLGILDSSYERKSYFESVISRTTSETLQKHFRPSHVFLWGFVSSQEGTQTAAMKFLPNFPYLSSVGRFDRSRPFFLQLWRTMWTSEPCMMLLGFFFDPSWHQKSPCVLKSDVKVFRQKVMILFLRSWSLENSYGLFFSPKKAGLWNCCGWPQHIRLAVSGVCCLATKSPGDSNFIQIPPGWAKTLRNFHNFVFRWIIATENKI